MDQRHTKQIKSYAIVYDAIPFACLMSICSLMPLHPREDFLYSIGFPHTLGWQSSSLILFTFLSPILALSLHHRSNFRTVMGNLYLFDILYPSVEVYVNRKEQGSFSPWIFFRLEDQE